MIFPQSLTSITFGYYFNQSIRNVNWPNIFEITLCNNYSYMDDLQSDCNIDQITLKHTNIEDIKWEHLQNVPL